MKRFSLKNEWITIIIVLSAASGALLAKNSVILPLDYDYTCLYGVPFACWEKCSTGGEESVSVLKAGYDGLLFSPVLFRLPVLNFLIDILILLPIFYLLKNGEKAHVWLRYSGFAATGCLVFALWTSVFMDWSLYMNSGRSLYLFAVLSESLIVSGAVMKLIYICLDHRHFSHDRTRS